MYRFELFTRLNQLFCKRSLWHTRALSQKLLNINTPLLGAQLTVEETFNATLSKHILATLVIISHIIAERNAGYPGSLKILLVLQSWFDSSLVSPDASPSFVTDDSLLPPCRALYTNTTAFCKKSPSSMKLVIYGSTCPPFQSAAACGRGPWRTNPKFAGISPSATFKTAVCFLSVSDQRKNFWLPVHTHYEVFSALVREIWNLTALPNVTEVFVAILRRACSFDPSIYSDHQFGKIKSIGLPLL